MTLKEFIYDNLQQTHYKQVQTEYSTLCTYIFFVLNGLWHGEDRINSPVLSNSWAEDYFEIIEDATSDDMDRMQFGDILEVVNNDLEYTTDPLRIWQQPYTYAIYANWGKGVISEAEENPDPDMERVGFDNKINYTTTTAPQFDIDYKKRWLVQLNQHSQNYEVITIDLKQRAIDAVNKRYAKVNIYRPKNSTNIFQGEREDITLDGGSHIDYPSVHLVKRMFNELGGTFRGDFSNYTIDENVDDPMEFVPKVSPDDRFYGELIKPKDFIIIRTLNDESNTMMKRIMVCKSVGGVSDMLDTSGAIVYEPAKLYGGWIDEEDGSNYRGDLTHLQTPDYKEPKGILPPKQYSEEFIHGDISSDDVVIVYDEYNYIFTPKRPNNLDPVIQPEPPEDPIEVLAPDPPTPHVITRSFYLRRFWRADVIDEDGNITWVADSWIDDPTEIEKLWNKIDQNDIDMLNVTNAIGDIYNRLRHIYSLMPDLDEMEEKGFKIAVGNINLYGKAWGDESSIIETHDPTQTPEFQREGDQLGREYQ